jgi:hypothetical protein
MGTDYADYTDGETDGNGGVWQAMCFKLGMKYIAVLLVAGGVYCILARQITVKPAAPAAPANGFLASKPGTDFLKEPLDRTHEVLDQAKQRSQDPALQ